MSEDYFNDQPQEGGGTQASTDFFESGSPSCRFVNIGDTHAGTILSFENAQQRDIVTGNPKFWPDGNKCEMLVITLQTNERDPEIDDDDGQRRLYVNKPSGMFAAIKLAVGKNKFAVGGTIAVKYVKNGKPKQAGFNAPKEYDARYAPPAGASVAHDTPAPSRTAPKPATGDTATASAHKQAWDAFRLEHEGQSDSAILPEWRELLAKIVPGKRPNEFNATEWQRVRTAATTPADPMSDEPQFADSDIPF